VFAAPSLLPRGKAPDLEALPWIGFDERMSQMQIARWFGRAMPDVRPRLRIDSFATMLRAAAAGAGAAVLPAFAASQEKGLVRVTELVPDVSMDLWVLSHPDLRGNARVRALADHLATTVPAELTRLLREGPRCPKFAQCPVEKRRLRRRSSSAEA